MLPALVVPGAPVHTDDPTVWASHPISFDFSRFSPLSQFERHQSSLPDMESSNAVDGASGIPKSNAQNPNFSFSAPSATDSRPVSGLSRPRFVKVRKQNNAQSLRSTAGIEENRVASGFNPFRPARDDSVRPFSGSGMGSKSILSEIDVGQTGNEAFVFGTKRSDSGSNSNMGNTGSGSNFDHGIVDRMRNLKMGNVNEVLNVKDISSNKKSSSGDGNLVSKLPEHMRKLNIGGNDDIDKPKGGGLNIYADEYTKFTSSSKDNKSGSCGVESELQNELKKKLSIKETHQVESSSTGDQHSDNSPNTLLHQMRNLNVKDSLGVDNVQKNVIDATTDGQKKTASASSKTTTSYIGGRTEANLVRKMEKLKVVSEKGDSTKPNFWYPSSHVSVGEFNHTGASDRHVFPDKPKEDIRVVKNAALSSSFSSVGINFPMVGNAFGVTKRDEFFFTGKNDDSGSSFIEFKTPGSNNEQSSNTKMKKKRGKPKLSTPVQLWHGHDFASEKNVSQENPEASDPYSPMDVSPYQETLAETRCLRENSVTSNESLSLDYNSTATDSVQIASNDPIDEDLIAQTECLTINECDAVCEEAKRPPFEYHIPKNIVSKVPLDESISRVETESLKSGNIEADITSDTVITLAETKSSPSSSIETCGSDALLHLSCASSSNDISRFSFTFAASSSAEAQAASPKRPLKKKNWVKVGYDTPSTTPSLKVSYSSPSLAYSSCSRTSSLFASGQDQKARVSIAQHKTTDSDINKEQRMKEEVASITAATIAARESCEKWRLRGNQAYKNGDLFVAEDCYTKGLECVSKDETSRSSLRALMLCYSNRAATRMSLGRMRDALEDCIRAAEIDPNFLRIQLRAANCYLALGEVGDALQYFKRCLQSGTDVCVDRKIAVEASDGLQKAQKVSELIDHSAELLRKRTTTNADKALEQINEALTISLNSESLLEMKAEALFMQLCKFEEVIQLCDQTIGSAEKNFHSLDTDGEVTNLDNSQLSKRIYFRLWRCTMKLKSYFHLGKLEEGLSSLEEHGKMVSSMNENGSKIFDSLLPLAVTVRELLQHKTAGNEAYQAGRHAEAVEHYTAALSCSVESRPFAAVCFCNRAAAYKALGHITDAIADCSLAIALDGNYLKALSRRAALHEKIRDYAQAANDLLRLVSLLSKGLEDKANQLGIHDRSINYANDLKQYRIWLSEIEEEARKEIPLDMYLILGVEPSVSASEIKKAYRKAALRHHPDKAGQPLARSDSGDDGMWKDIAEEVRRDADRLFKIIGEAYAMLSDPAKRARYNAEEEMRNGQKKRYESSCMARSNVDNQCHPFEQGSRRWREIWRSYGNSSSRGSEPGRSGGY